MVSKNILRRIKPISYTVVTSVKGYYFTYLIFKEKQTQCSLNLNTWLGGSDTGFAVRTTHSKRTIEKSSFFLSLY